MSTWYPIIAGIVLLCLSGCGETNQQLVTMAENADFRDRVLGIAREVFPAVEFSALQDDPDVLLAGEMRLGLQNIRAKFQLEQHSEIELRTLVEDHFGPVIRKEAPSLDDFTLDEVRDQLFPQIMPSGYVGAAPLPLVSFAFASGIRIGVVADFPQTYMYLRQADLTRWGISQEAVYDIAIRNLEEASKGVEIHLNETASETFIAIESGDGYDAARILVPGIQKYIASRIGEIFRFGIPNRDFLICWPVNSAESFHMKMEANISRDNSERPYPLSPAVFVRNSEGNIQEQKSP